MQKSERQSFLRWLCLYRLFGAALLLISLTAVAQGADYYAELPRFHQISDRLYRGAQPRKGGIHRLAGLGVNTIINLRGSGAHTRADEAEARSVGLEYFNIPLPVWARPSDASVRRIMEIINAPESGRVFVHCKDGVDRTGTIVALHRITSEGWSTELATAEAVRYGMRRYQYWMRDYIGDYHVRQRAPNEGDAKDKIGAGVRVGERAVLKVRKTAERAVRRALP